jgi:hypothetical protein
MARRSQIWPAVLCVVALLALAALTRRHPKTAQASEAEEAAPRLFAFEALRRSLADFTELATWDQLSGPDPYSVLRLPGSNALVGILRGADAVVLLDGALAEKARVAAPPSPTALAVADDGSIFVAGELSKSIARYRIVNDRFVKTGSFEVPAIRAIRGLAAGSDGWLYAVEEHRGHLLGLKLPRSSTGQLGMSPRFDMAVGNGPLRIERVEQHLVIDCLLDHAIVILELDPGGAPSAAPPIRIVHDGPIWSFAVKSAPAGLRLALGGVEDHPLDRTIGAFGYIDSFLYFYEVDLAAGRATRQGAINVSELGVVTPKALTFTSDGSDVVVAGYGSDRLIRVGWADRRANLVTSFVPGANVAVELSGGALAFADPLLDAWILKYPEREPVVVPIAATDDPRQSADPMPVVRLGEALFFTTAMAPWNRSDGPLSRFTCETCHFEGYVDGRTHHTGRGEVHAVTKPLLGLFNNRPHFSRALDEDLATVAFNEFRVANARSGRDPWFALSLSQFPWLRPLGLGAEELSPELLRRALMAFLMSFNHRPNPMTLGRAHFSEGERIGAAVFRDRCESCHQARTVSDVPDSRVPFERWESLIFSHQGPIVWAKSEYEKTGVVPYVHERGARVPSLRRLYKKRPYFTNGSAPTLGVVLERVRFDPDAFWHEAPDEEASTNEPNRGRLDEYERRALLDFLDLL